MKRLALIAASAALPLILAAPALRAQTGPPPVVADLLQDMKTVHKKLVDLANAMPADKYDWRPGEGVRSVGEVFKHVASDNYLIPALAGAKPPVETGITTNYQTASAFEARKLDKAAIVAQLDKSFDWVENQLAGTAQARLRETVNMFGNDTSVRALWVMTTTHMHEHLGQAIAYARMNGVVPPWSR
jgi:uncharacterized damage-inducible protein DinB